MNQSGYPPQINIVVPLYNEEVGFEELIKRLDKLILSSINLGIEVILIDDGSSDNTRQLIEQKSLNNKSYTGVFLSRNFGPCYSPLYYRTRF